MNKQSKRIGAVIVAAGLSSRMGDFKPLMNINDKTMIETTISNFETLGVDKIVVVTGFRSADIKRKLNRYKIKIIVNRDYNTTEMFDSVCIGLKELYKEVDMAFITPVDSPFVQQFTLQKMVEEMEKDKLKIVQPVYEKQGGHPLLLNKEAMEAMFKHDGKMGMKGGISKIGSYKRLEFVDPGIVMSGNNMTDYFELLEYSYKKNCPSIDLCEKIQDYFDISKDVRKHCNKVTYVALDLCGKLFKKGIELDKNIIIAASMLHDIAKGNSKHAQIGASWLKDMGYDKIAEIVNEHMELETISSIPTEKELLYLADKMVKGDKIVSIDERFAYKEALYNDNKIVIRNIRKRKDQALEIYQMTSGV